MLLSDADAYASTLDILEHVYPLVSPGGFVLIDDFHIPECRAAVLEYRRARGMREPMLPAPCDYVFGCRRTPRGTPIHADTRETLIAPHVMYWERQQPESELLPFRR